LSIANHSTLFYWQMVSVLYTTYWWIFLIWCFLWNVRVKCNTKAFPSFNNSTARVWENPTSFPLDSAKGMREKLFVAYNLRMRKDARYLKQVEMPNASAHSCCAIIMLCSVLLLLHTHLTQLLCCCIVFYTDETSFLWTYL
jgi:hypothetical protein